MPGTYVLQYCNCHISSQGISVTVGSVDAACQPATAVTVLHAEYYEEKVQ